MVKFTVVLFGASLLVAACLSADFSSADESPRANNELVRANFKLPQLFDFDQFKALFQKSYSSLVEELVRKKIFLARAFQSFITAIRYKFRKLAYYLGINWMSDWTEEDLNRNKVHTRDMIDPEDGSENVLLDDSGDSQQAKNSVPAASLEEIERELSEIERRKNEPGYEELASEIESLKRQKRAADPRSQLSFDDLMRSPDGQEPPEVMQKILRDGVPRNNPDYEPFELTSYGADDGSETPKIDFQAEARRIFENLADNPLAKFIGQFTQDLAKEKLEKQRKKLTEEATRLKEARAKYVLPEVDHRKSNCFFQPRSQGECGSCYAFTAIALYEWLYCKITGNLVALSEQFMVDCGQRTGLNGCKGGNFGKVANFVGAYGLELRKNYPYRRKLDQCPYEPDTDATKMGYLKFLEHGPTNIKIDYIHRFLNQGPMMIGIMLGPNFRQYAGGIDDNADCRPDDGHGMLLVGSGSEDGKDYWIMRNSHSVSWGETGYYRLAKERFYECAVYKFGVMISASLSKKHNLNDKRYDYLYEPVKLRYNEYVQKGV